MVASATLLLTLPWNTEALSAEAASVPEQRPNVLVVLVDDLGFSDIGCYGSEIETPNLDRLAENGLRFSQFYNTAKCHSSRISLLTGCYAYEAGNTKMDRAVTSAEVLSNAGYFSMMTEKWHLKKEPTDFGFDRYFGHLSGACNYFSGDDTFRLNGEKWNVPEADFYTTVANVDFALEFLKEARTTHKPWYLYVAFNAPHAPLHALAEDYHKYKGRYDRGWDEVRDDRIAKQKRLGLLPARLEPSPRPDHVPAWNSLSEKRRGWESRRMTTLAAMIDRVDQEIGRLLRDLEAAKELDNTFIMFMSDNGACPYDRLSNNLEAEPTDKSIRWGDSTGWAWARNSPFRYYKQNQFEGGISSPAIVHWPRGLKTKRGAIVDQPAHLIDVLPTLAELCGVELPTKWPDRQLGTISGISLVPILRGDSMAERPPIHLLYGSDRGLRDGDWKLVSFRNHPWELYNMADDRTELHDLAKQHPERLQKMVATWTEMAEQVLQAPKRSYGPVATVPSPHVHSEWTDFDSEPSPGVGKKRNVGKKKKAGKKAGAGKKRRTAAPKAAND
jgi:arylsulfatase